MKKGNLIIIKGSTNSGKLGKMLGLAADSLVAGNTILVFSYDLSASALAGRISALVGSKDVDKNKLWVSEKLPSTEPEYPSFITDLVLKYRAEGVDLDEIYIDGLGFIMDRYNMLEDSRKMIGEAQYNDINIVGTIQIRRDEI